MGKDNKTRAKRALNTTAFFVKSQQGEHFEPCCLGENITDLLSDLQHLAHSKGIDFASCLRMATGNFEAEFEEEGGEMPTSSLTSVATKAKPVLAIHLEGGLVQGVFSDDPSYFEGVDVLVYDYDFVGADEDEKINVVYTDGETHKAVGHIQTVCKPAIDISATIGGM
jgi:hypothetical protein